MCIFACSSCHTLRGANNFVALRECPFVESFHMEYLEKHNLFVSLLRILEIQTRLIVWPPPNLQEAVSRLLPLSTRRTLQALHFLRAARKSRFVLRCLEPAASLPRRRGFPRCESSLQAMRHLWGMITLLQAASPIKMAAKTRERETATQLICPPPGCAVAASFLAWRAEGLRYSEHPLQCSAKEALAPQTGGTCSTC